MSDKSGNRKMNKIILSAGVLQIFHEELKLHCRIHGAEYPLVCYVENPDVLDGLKPGMDIVMTGCIGSRDTHFKNPCSCETYIYGVETYVVISEWRPVDRNDFMDAEHNEVSVSGYAVSPLTKVNTKYSTFYTTRISLPDEGGYVTVSYDKAREITRGCHIEAYGFLKAKDYNKRMVCPSCRLKTVHQMLSAVVVATE